MDRLKFAAKATLVMFNKTPQFPKGPSRKLRTKDSFDVCQARLQALHSCRFAKLTSERDGIAEGILRVCEVSGRISSFIHRGIMRLGQALQLTQSLVRIHRCRLTQWTTYANKMRPREPIFQPAVSTESCRSARYRRIG